MAKQDDRSSSRHPAVEESGERPGSADSNGNGNGRVGPVQERPAEPDYREPATPAVEQRRLGGVVVPAPAIGAAQLVALLIGIAFVGVGAVGLSRGGFEELNLHSRVMGIPHTPLLGFMELLFGVVLIIAAAVPYAGRWVLIGAGAFLAICGLLFVITPATFNPALGVEALNGWLYILAGIVTLLVGIVIPRTAELRRSN